MGFSSFLKGALRYGLILFMFIAGINHLINPQFYIPLIPDYLPNPSSINLLSGLLEILFSVLLVPSSTRKFSALAIIILLILFIPSHIYFIQIGACVEEGLCTPKWVAWTRLILVHPLLMLWSWKVGRN